MTQTNLNGKSWESISYSVFQLPDMKDLKSKINRLRQETTIYPDSEYLFAPFNLCPYKSVKMVIFDDEPYPFDNISDGLAYSSRTDLIPDNLKNIFLEIYDDLNIQYKQNIRLSEYFQSGSLTKWAENGILLINLSLTVEKDKPGSHKDIGWSVFANAIIDALNDHQSSILFLLWGDKAKALKPKIDTSIGRHQVLEYDHPRDWIGKCRHFSIARDILPVLDNVKYNHVNLYDCIDIEKAYKKVHSSFAIDEDKIMYWLKNELQLNYWLDKDKHMDYLRKFELSFKTFKQISNETK